jgi:acetyl esterase
MSEPYVRPDVRGFLDFLNNLPGPRMHQLDAATARAQYVAMKDVADLPVGELGTMIDFSIPGPAGDLPARLFDPRQRREPGSVVVFFHGGGFVIGNIDTHAGVCAEIARQLDRPVISVDYRLAPEHCWPAAPDDCEAAARWVASSPAVLGRAVTGLILAGDSAGGNLAIVTALALRDAPAAAPVVAQFPIYPVVDSTRVYPSFEAFSEGYLLTKDSMAYFNDAYRADIGHQRGSPLLADLAALPPAVVLTASLDPLRDQGRAYAGALIAAGVPTVYREAVGNIHGFVTIRKAIPSGVGDLAGALAALKLVLVEAEGQAVMRQAA